MNAVYFIETADGRHFKIGMSNDPVSRLAKMQGYNPEELRLVAVLPVPGDSQRRHGLAVERRFHERYLHLHCRGEWFHSAPIIREDAAAIAAGVFDVAALPTALTEASLLRSIWRGPRKPIAVQAAAA